MKKFVILVGIMFFVPLSFADQSVKIVTAIADNCILDEWKEPGKYSPPNIFDGDIETAFSEDSTDSNNFSIYIKFDKYCMIDEIQILNGYNKSKNLFEQNNRIKNGNICLYEKSTKKSLIDTKYSKKFSYKLSDTNNLQSIFFPEDKIIGLCVSARDVYKGTRYDDTCISEIKFFYKGKEIKIANLEEIKTKYLEDLSSDLKEFFNNKRYSVGDDEGTVLCNADGTMSFRDRAPDEVLETVKPTNWKVEDHKLYMKVNGQWELVDYWLHWGKELMVVGKIGHYDFNRNFQLLDE